MNSSYVPFSTGTTIMAAEYDGGVVIGADSRTSAAGYVINRVADKLTRITDNIYCCRSGAAADTQAIADHVTTLLRHHQFSKGKPAEVRMAANEFRKCCYANRRSMLAGIIVAGWDGKCGGQVYNIPLGGMMLRMPYAIGGSGSLFSRLLEGQVQARHGLWRRYPAGQDGCQAGHALRQQLRRSGARWRNRQRRHQAAHILQHRVWGVRGP